MEILKPGQDERLYRHLELPNKLQVLLISDPQSDKGAAAMDVHVGHLSDPEELPGLAHFCEHLLFMGTTKYPSENEYSQYLSTHGGHSNAFTSSDHTNYFFDVAADHLDGALDRFAQFFVAPLFDDSCTDRELQAVDSEHKKNLQSDGWRSYQLEKDLSDPSHPYSKFGTGNLQTLKVIPESKGINPRSVLLQWYQAHYSANIMRLVVLGRESLDILAASVIEKFSGIPNKDLQPPNFIGHPFTKDYLGLHIIIQSIKEVRHLELSFPLPDCIPHYRTQPQRYLSHLLGHESEGSILSLLKKKGWAFELMAGASRGGSGFEFFKISIELTGAGMDHYEEIVQMVFEYIELMKRAGPQEWIYRECQKLAEISFNFKEKIAPATYTSKVAAAMQHYPPKEILSGPHLLHEYKPELISELLNCLRPDSFRLSVMSDEFESEGWPQAKYYGTLHQVVKIDDSLLDKLAHLQPNPDLHLPTPNKFIPTDLTVKAVKPMSSSEPQLIKDTPKTRVWFKKDNVFFVPKANIWLYFTSPLLYANPESSVMCKLFLKLMEDKLTEFSYNAAVADLHYSLESQTGGFYLSVDGYNDKLGVLLKEIIDRIAERRFDPERFDVVKEQVFRGYKNWYMEAPHQHAIYYGTHLTQEHMWSMEEKLKVISRINLSKLNNFIQLVMGSLHLEVLAHGNLDQTQVLDWVKDVESTLSFQELPFSERMVSVRTLKIPQGSRFVYCKPVHDPANLNSAIEYTLQVADYDDLKQKAAAHLLAFIMREPCFDQLRTKEQLGYIVFSGIKKQTGVFSFRIIIQSERHPIYLEQRIETFLSNAKDLLRNMPLTEFEKFKRGLASKLTEKDKNLAQESKRYWSQVNARYYDFNCHKTDAETVLSMDLSDILQFYDNHVAVESPLRRKLSVHLVSQKCPAIEGDIQQSQSFIKDSEEAVALFKFGMELSKAAQPVKPLASYSAN